MITKRTLLPVLLFTALAGIANAQKIAVKKGQKLETITTTKMSMEVMGQNMDNESSLTAAVEVKDVNADSYLFTNIIKRMQIKVSGMGQDVSFDSDKKEDMDGQIGQTLKDHIGTVQEIQVDKQGKVSGLTDTTRKAGGMADMMSMTGDMTKGQPYPMLIQLPAKAVKPGDTWTDSSGTPATMKTVYTYTLKNISADGAVVSYTGTMAKSGTVSQNGMDIQMDMNGTTKGESTYETGSGLLKTSTGTLDMKGTMGIMGQNAPITATISTNIIARKSL
ncbi:MAG: DUF6263 family protein [Bacteroidota bacterium]